MSGPETESERIWMTSDWQARCRILVEENDRLKTELDATVPPDPDKIVDDIIADLNGRSGLGIDDVDEDVQDHIRSAWIRIVRGA